MAASMGHQSKMAVDSALPFDTSSIPIEFRSESLAKTGVILESDGIRGTRSHAGERVRTGPYTCAGTTTHFVSPLLLDNFLPSILGAAEVVISDTFGLAETLTPCYLMFDRIGKLFTYAGCVANRATIRGSAGQPLEISIDWEALTETVAVAGGFPVLTQPTEQFYVMSDCVFTMQASARSMSEFEIVIDNALVTDRFQNATTRAEIPAGDRIVTARFTTPYTSSETDLYNQALAGAAVTIVATNADTVTKVLTISLPKFQVPDRSPTVQSKGEIVLQVEGVARKTGSTNEISIINANA